MHLNNNGDITMANQETEITYLTFNDNQQKVLGQEFHTDSEDNMFVRIGFKDPDPDSKTVQYIELKITDLLNIIAKSVTDIVKSAEVTEQINKTMIQIENTGKTFSNRITAAVKAFKDTTIVE